MERLFEPGLREKAIETTCQNLIMAGGILTHRETALFMVELSEYTDVQLGIALLESHLLLDNYLEKCWGKN